MKVTFTLAEYAAICLIGVMRHLIAVKLNRHEVNGSDPFDWSMQIQGALGEAALAKSLNVFWMGGEFKKGDVGEFEVRATKYRNGCLVIRDIDKDDRAYILVTLSGLSAEIVGWMYAKEAKQKRFLKDYNDRKPAYFVPQNQLNPVQSLYKLDTKAA